MSEEKDIVERLRSLDAWNDPAVCGEAADVIDALWAEIDRLDSRNKSLDAQCMAMHAEIERLTAAHKHQYEMAGLMLREAERNSKDAERYRFLRDDPEGYRRGDEGESMSKDIEPVAWQNKLVQHQIIEREHLDPMWYDEFQPLYSAAVIEALRAERDAAREERDKFRRLLKDLTEWCGDSIHHAVVRARAALAAKEKA